MELVRSGSGAMRRPPFPDAPTVEVIAGGDDGGPDVALIRIQVPVGTGMPPHEHGGSDIVLMTVSGFVAITKGEERVEVHPGDAVVIRKDEKVALANPGAEPAQLLVAAGPPNFVAGVRSWPEPEADADAG